MAGQVVFSSDTPLFLTCDYYSAGFRVFSFKSQSCCASCIVLSLHHLFISSFSWQQRREEEYVAEPQPKLYEVLIRATFALLVSRVLCLGLLGVMEQKQDAKRELALR